MTNTEKLSPIIVDISTVATMSRRITHYHLQLQLMDRFKELILEIAQHTDMTVSFTDSRQNFSVSVQNDDDNYDDQRERKWINNALEIADDQLTKELKLHPDKDWYAKYLS